MKIVALIKGSIGSIRLPGKVLKKLVGITMIEIPLMRQSHSKTINEICVVDYHTGENDVLYNLVEKLGYRILRSFETDLLKRFWDAAEATSADVVVRIKGDCPVDDPKLVDKVVDLHLNSHVDYPSNINSPTFPDGLDVEDFGRRSLENANFCQRSDFDREHVTSFTRDGNFKELNLRNVNDTSELLS